MFRTMGFVALGALMALTLQVQAQDRQERREDQQQNAEARRLVGTWTVASEEQDGKQTTATDVKGKQVRFTRDTITCMGKEGKADLQAKYTLDTSSKPWKIRMEVTEGEHKGKTMQGVVQFQDESTLRICYAKPDAEAPTGFRTQQDQHCYTLRRAERGGAGGARNDQDRP